MCLINNIVMYSSTWFLTDIFNREMLDVETGYMAFRNVSIFISRTLITDNLLYRFPSFVV